MIRRFGNSCLRRRAEDVEPGSAEARRLLDEMWRTLAADGGVGLAAPQVGVARRVVVIRDTGRRPGRQRLDLVNPVLRETFGEPERFNEGCLSFPGLYIDVWRRRGVELSYFDRSGEARQLRDEGLLARIALHELDHLDGVLFIDRIPRLKRWLLMPRLWLIALGNLIDWFRIRKRRGS